MNKNEYLDRLSRLLADISYEEHEEALSYYREYLEDAGIENEQHAMEELGTPEQLAQKIREGLSEKGEPSKRQGTPISAPQLSPQDRTDNDNNSYSRNTYDNAAYNHNTHNYDTYNHNTAKSKKEKNKSTVILIIIALILTLPLWFSLACTVISVIFACIVAIIAIAIGVGAAGIVCTITGIGLIIAGFAAFLSIPVFSVSGTLAGFTLIGAGLVVMALGILFIILTVWLCGWALPALVRLIRQTVSGISRKRKEAHL